MKNITTLVYITNVCDKSCPDCYYPHGLESMSPLVASQVISWLKKTCEEEHVEYHGATFLGGEPLENQDILFQLIEGFQSQLPMFTKRPYPGGPKIRPWENCNYIVFTNGDKFTPELLDKFHYYRATLRLNPTHDSMEVIKEKSRLLKEHCGGVAFSVVADEFNLPRLHELAKLAVDLNGHIRISRLYEGGKDPKYIEEFGKAMHKVFDVLLAAEVPMWPDWILESTWIMYNGEKNPNLCGKYQVIIDPDGSFRSCAYDMGTGNGHISTHSFRDLKFVQRWSAKNIPECQGCPWITWCQGGCPYTRKTVYGSYDNNQASPFCPVFKELFPRLMELVVKYKQVWAKTLVEKMKERKHESLAY